MADGIKVTYNHILMKICSVVLTEFPYANSSFDGRIITVHDDINIGLAVSVENGLMVPNVKKVQEKSVAEIVLETDRIIQGAKTMKLKYDDLTGGTFTISNLGMFGVESFSPIINQPELAILGVNAIIDKPVALNGEIVIRPMMTLNLVADHRVVDGVYAAKILSGIKGIIENPEVMVWK
jgi:pyruvate dehydrogenase E2 component (dihydrolipoamide acetyltransferase)